jgi:erythromycin esterase-like protein
MHRTTSMGDMGEWNVGQLARERFGNEAVLVGFSTYTGTVTAASDWDAPAERKRVRPGLPGSFEALFPGVGTPDFLLRRSPPVCSGGDRTWLAWLPELFVQPLDVGSRQDLISKAELVSLVNRAASKESR